MDVLSNLELNKDVGIVFTGNPACSNEIISTIKKEENKGLNISNVDLLTVSQINGLVRTPQYNGEITIKPGNSEHAKLFLSSSEFLVTNGLSDPVIVAKEGVVSTGSISEFATYNINGQSLNIRENENYDSNIIGKIEACASGDYYNGVAYRISSNTYDFELKNDYTPPEGVASDYCFTSYINLNPNEIEARTYCLYINAESFVKLEANPSTAPGTKSSTIKLFGSTNCSGGSVIELCGSGYGKKESIKFANVDDVVFCNTNVNVMDGDIYVNTTTGGIQINGNCSAHLIFNNKHENFACGKNGYAFEIVTTQYPTSHIIRRNIFDEQQNCVGFIRFDFPNILPTTCTIDVGFKLDNAIKGQRTEFVAFKSDIPTFNHLEFANPIIPENCSLYEVSLAPTTFTKTPIMQLTNKSGATQVADLCYDKTSNKVFVGIDHDAQIAAGEYNLTVFGM